jgi:glycosyltransferase involved in cell wall biosynthesis
MKTPFFSIVIPTFNRSDLFPYAVQSILNQTFEDFEIIISDNCSEDDTPETAKQFTDPRVSYVRTPRHHTIPDSWEFARSNAKGKLIIMLSDDDALVGSALEQFQQQSERYDADFLFSRVVEYYDQSLPGTDRNRVTCPEFSGIRRRVSVEEFVGPLCAGRPKFHLHPSAFAFSKSVADTVAQRTGRFFWTNGVEYSAWLSAALFAKGIVYVDLPLTIKGHSSKSWTTNISLYNPGKEQIQKLIKDVDQERKHTPFNNFTMCNLMAEGVLLAKSQFPEELAPYEFNEVNYLRGMIKELKRRRAMGVDVSVEMDDALRYSQKYPSLSEEFSKDEATTSQDWAKKLFRRIRSTAADLGGRTLRRRVNAYQLTQKLKGGPMRSGFTAYGEDFGFYDIVECAKFIGRIVRSSFVKDDSTRDIRGNEMIERSIERA